MKIPDNLSELFEQAKDMQANFSEMQEEIKKREVEASAGGGMVVATVNGAQQVTKLTIEPEVISAEEKEMLEELIRAAVNEGMRKSQELMKEELAKLTGGLNIPGLFPGK